ncbi:MAG: hypothetical protein B6I24_00445 [Bacteroidetes bacterium 4572_128]|nr:MAG: hypothetical protein B6I24_00445 [Bacteroidetes bacterium 4572_128]
MEKKCKFFTKKADNHLSKIHLFQLVLRIEKIGRIALRFLSQKELKDIDFNQRIKHLYLHWCAKETLFKVYEDRALEFKENLKILNFKVNEEGTFEGIIDKNNIKEKYILNYFVKNNFVVVWTFVD